MVRSLTAVLALTAALPAIAQVSSATIDGRQISYNATSTNEATRMAQRPLGREDVLGMLRNARPVTPAATLPADTLDPITSMPQHP